MFLFAIILQQHFKSTWLWRGKENNTLPPLNHYKAIYHWTK